MQSKITAIFTKIIFALLILTVNAYPNSNFDSLHVNPTVKIIPGPEYEAGWLHRYFLGDHWRNLWVTPIDVPLLNLEAYAGGLKPIKRGGGFQTKSLHFKGNDGKYYKFRSINKDPKKVLPEDFRNTFVADIVQDQISTSHPLSAIIVAPLLNAVDVLNAQPIIVILPDDPKLGEFRQEFKNVLGTFAENPKDDTEQELIFAGADKIVDDYEVFEKLEKDNDDLVDAASFLKARLMDIFLGDWDRHIGQWKWGRFKKNNMEIWQPIPRDRDQAFSRYDGLFPYIASLAITQIEHFSKSYPQINDLTWSGRFLDRRFLVSLDKASWDSITTFVQNRLTDDVIVSAVKKMPENWFTKEGIPLINILKKRRDNLKEISYQYYRLIFKYVSIYASNDAEYTEINRLDDYRVEVAIYDKNKEGMKKAVPFYYRVFDRDHTKEIRVHLLDDNDTAVISGDVNSSILVRVIGGDGADELIDNSWVHGYFLSAIPIPDAETKTIFYDSGEKTTFKIGPSTKINTDKAPEVKPYDPDKDEYNEKYAPQTEDRGHDWKAGVWLGYNSNDGFTIGGGPILYEFGFRVSPYVYRMSLLAAYVTNLKALIINFNSQFYSLIKNTKVTLDVKQLVGYTNFYGFGNETKIDGDLEDADYYQVRPHQEDVAAALEFQLSPVTKIWTGLSFYHQDINYEENSILNQNQLKIFKDESYLGVNFGFQLDTRDYETAPSKGLFIDVRNHNYRMLISKGKGFNKLSLDARGYLQSNVLTTSTFALRGSAEKMWGDFPITDAAFLGGKRNLRGFVRERFAGNALLFGGLELRSYLFPLKVIIPGRFGFTAFAETGRVFQSGEQSDKWHPSYGGGAWMSFLGRTLIANLTIAKSYEDLLLYITTDFMF